MIQTILNHAKAYQGTRQGDQNLNLPKILRFHR